MSRRVRMLAVGTTAAQSRSVRIPRGENVSPPQQSLITPGTKLQAPIIDGAFVMDMADRVVDISIGEVRGPAKVKIAAGAIEMGAVIGDCDVATRGGPLNLGEISGNLQARTGAGDILVRAARLGGDSSRAGPGGGVAWGERGMNSRASHRKSESAMLLAMASSGS